ncbi:histidine kinase [Microbacterium sp. NPDC058345]|uniref:sensor histidine kinase n=1 Tax=Microbacterium sp. NPDC058345 TaxID=3346455 RepID=UPI003668D018
MASSATSRHSRIPSWVGDAVAVCAVVAPALVPEPHRPGPRPEFEALMLLGPVIVAIGLVLLRRRWPVPILTVAVVLFCASVLVDRPSTPLGYAAVLTAYVVGSRTTRLVTLIAGVAATAIVAVLSVTVSDFGVIDPRVFQIAAGVAVAAALGDSSRSHREYVRAATERAERAEQTREAEAQQRVAEERLRIAQDLHDTVAHQISVISLNAGVASRALDDDAAKARRALGTIRSAARGALTEIGELLRYLRTDSDAASAVAPQPTLKDLPALLRRLEDSGLRVEVQQTGDVERIADAAGLVAYRVIQEALTNAHKHGSGGTASVRIAVAEADDQVEIVVGNPVSAADRNQSDPPGGGLGLIGIRERVASARGTVGTQRLPDEFLLRVRLPLRRQEQP